MSPAAASLLNSAMSLPEAERLAIADALLSSVPEDATELDDVAFVEELRRRSEEMDIDPSAYIPWEEVKKQL